MNTKRIIKTICLILALILPAVAKAGNDQPHNTIGGQNVDCGSCHWTQGATPPWASFSTGKSMDDVTVNRRCYTCHLSGATMAKTHSTATTSTKYWTTYGGWSVTCYTCHDPHVQPQQRIYTTESYLGTAKWTSMYWNTLSGYTRVNLDRSLPGNYVGYYFIPDTKYSYLYKIISWNTLSGSQLDVKGLIYARYAGTTGSAIVYAKNIRNEIGFTNPSGTQIIQNVKLYQPSGAHALADAANASTSVCNVCHTQTEHMRASWVTQSAPDQWHANYGWGSGQSCFNQAGCHQTHPEGFKKGATCGDCHGTPPTYWNSVGGNDMTTAIKTAGVVSSTSTGVNSPGAHVAHKDTLAQSFTNRQIGCWECHTGGMTNPQETDPTIGDKVIDIGFAATGGSYTVGTYYGRTGLLNGYSYGGPSAGTADGTMRCSNVYCHGGTIGASTSPVWTASSVACGDCHKALSANPPTLGSHKLHAGTTSTMMASVACTQCHGHDGNNAAAHVDGAASVSLNTADSKVGANAKYAGSSSGSYGPVPNTANYANCTAVYCHSNGLPADGSATWMTVKWGGNAMTCSSCHDAAGAKTAMSRMSRAHLKHASTDADSYGSRINCSLCHLGTTTNGTTISSIGKHLNVAKDVDFNTANNLVGASASPYNSGNKSCSQIYCHSDGKATPTYVNATWTTASSGGCGTCHVSDAAQASSLSGAHAKHAGTTANYVYACYKCHTTVLQNTQIATLSANGISTTHVNKTRDVAIDMATPGGGSFSATAGTCSASYCHSNAKGTYAVAPAWGSATTNCTSCHQNPPAYGNGGAGTATANSHMTHWGTYGIGCQKCHYTTTQNGTSIWNDPTQKHVNGINDVAYDSQNPSGWYTAGSNVKMCGNTYCHSNGTPRWGEALTCASCHGYTAASGVWLTTGMHAKHTSTSWSAVTCNRCHNTVTTTGNTITNFANHANGSKDIAFDSFDPGAGWDTSTKSCSSVYCHSAVQGAWGSNGGFTYTVATWTSVGTGSCDKCHGAYTTTPALASGSHTLHFSQGKTDCNYCHNNAGEGTAKHADKVIDISVSVGGSYSQGSAAPGTGYGSCAGVSCHGTGNYQWGTGSGCSSCHKKNNTLLGLHAKHYDSATEATVRTAAPNTSTTNYIYTCGVCHNVEPTNQHNTGQVSANQRVDVIFDAVTAGGSYSAGASAGWDTMASGDPYAWTKGTCNSVYCHSDGAGTYKSPVWTSAASAGCAACHNYDVASGSPMATGMHTKHVATYTQFDCGKCHSATVNAYSSILDKTIHINQKKEVQLAAWSGGSWATSSKSCAATYCHSDGLGAYTSPLWTSVGSGACGTCHATSALATNAHGAHINNATAVGRAIGCSECHSATAKSNTTINIYTIHSDKNVNVRFDNASLNKDSDGPTYNGSGAWSTLTAGSAKAAGSAVASCNNVYCHSVGNLNGAGTVVAAGGASFRNTAWNSTGFGCDSCHGGGGKSHPWYTSGAAASTTANSHVKHVESSSFGCDYCHNLTTTDTAIPPTTVVNGGKHLNRTEDVSFKLNGGSTGLWDSVGKTCSATYCHGSAPSTAWGGSTTCASCHSATNAGLSTRHDKHYNTTTAATVLAGGTNSHTNDAYVYACLNCHPTSSHAGGAYSTIAAAWVTGTRMASYTYGGTWTTDASGFRYTNGGSCATMCHTKDGVTAGTAITAAAWNGTNSQGCGFCHNKPGDSSPTWTTPHSKHLNTYAGNAMMSCNSCHSGTAASNTTILAAGKGQHPNSNRELAFNATVGGTASGAQGSQQCSNTYCHSNGTAASGTHAAISWLGNVVTCASCHGDSATLATNAHQAHLNNATAVGRTIGCGECHSATTTDGTTISDVADHVDKNVNVRFDNASLNKDSDGPTYNGSGAWSTLAAGSAKAAGSAVASCNNVYCHSVGNLNGAGAVVTAGGASFRNTAWNSTGFACDSCHGGGGKSHPWYTSGAAASTTANSHVKHVESSSFTCDYCHNTTTTDGTTVINGGKHLNRTEDVSFKLNGGSTGLWDSVGKTCSATYCHGSGASTAWGGATTCDSCHDATNAGLSTRHDKHYNTTTAATVLAGGTNSHTNDAYVFACLNCHPTNSHAGGAYSTIAAAWVTGTRMASYTYGGSWATDAHGFRYTVGGSCATMCHTKDGVTAGTAITAPAWNGTNGQGCGFCHNKPGDSSPTWTTPHSKHLNTYASNPNFTCNSCHSGTAASNTTILAAGKGQHPNSNRDLAMNTWVGGTVSGAQGSQQCTNTYCHSNGQWATGSHAASSWTGTKTCASCHGAKGAGWSSITTGSHGPHIAMSSVTCGTCHAATTTNGTAITDVTRHVTKNVDIQLWSSVAGSSATYNGQPAGGASVYAKTVGTAKSTCNTTYCHGGQSSVWGTVTAQATCVKCHGVDGTSVATYSGDNRYAAPGFNGTGHNTWNTTGALTNGVSNDSKVGAHDKHLRASTVWGTLGYMDGRDVTCDSCHTVYTTPVQAGHMSGATALVWGTLARGINTSYTSFTGVLTPSYSGGQCSNVYCHGAGFWTSSRGTGVAPGWTSSAYLTASAPTMDSASCNKCHMSPPTKLTRTGGSHSAAALGTCNGCHGHNGWGTMHINGTMEASGGSCNSCHWFGLTDSGAWTTTNGISGGTGLLMNQSGWGAHINHINVLQKRWGSVLYASGTTFGDANYNLVCGVCHTKNEVTNHNQSPNTRQINFGDGSTADQFGTSAPSWGTVTRSCSNIDCHFKGTPQW